MNNIKNFLCIDVGTTRFKAAIVNSLGEIIDKKDYYYRNALSNSFKLHYYNERDFYEAFKVTLDSIKINFDLNKISAIGVTGHGQTLVPMGKGPIPIYKSFGFLDDRIAPYTDTVRRNIPDDTVSLMYIPIALFFKQELSSIYNSINNFLTPSDYIAFLLTKNYFTSVSSPTIEPWKVENLRKFNLDTNKFPKFIYMGQKIGNTTSEAKHLFEIPEGTPVIATGGDFAMGELGSGAIEIGKSYLRFGTSAGINLCWYKNINDKRLLSYKHFIKPLWNISAIINTAGISVDWANKILQIKNIPKHPGRLMKDLLFFPYLKGEKTPFWNPNMSASLIGIKKGIDKHDILISILTGIAMGIREGIEIIEKNGGKFSSPIIASGWWTGIDWFMQIISNTTGKKCGSIQNNDAELLGVAIVLSKASGIYSDIKTGVKEISKIKKVYEPEQGLIDFYNNLYEKYIYIRDNLYGHSSVNL